MTIQQILLKYWGHKSFRPLQEDIINSVLEGKDTLALLPTGGGKSICFQVPALKIEGVCLVITPLIALMKDQVENLKNKNIKAVAIYSGMHRNEIEIALNNCIYGDVKFLYLSPERLETISFREILRQMKVGLIAVDEAHCISQWGYDFRPPYLTIAKVRPLLPGVPVLALTATATVDVVQDIQEKLLFPVTNVFRKSFERKNLTYYVIKEEDKFNRLLRIVRKIKGSGIVYVRSRRKTKEISDFFNKNNITSDYYNAGLDNATRDIKQKEWMKGRKRIMVATNAFGMGIDKPDVRFVVHIDIPDSLEAYFQEAGRAGRDEKQSHAILMFDDADLSNARRNFAISFPDPDKIRDVYRALGNYFQLPVGGGRETAFDFDIHEFCENYKFSSILVHNALRFLEKEGYLLTNEALATPSRIIFRLEKEDIYKFQVENPGFDNFIKVLLRSYSGIFSDFVKINENLLAKRIEKTIDYVVTTLLKLNKLGVVIYIRQNTKPQIIYCRERVDIKNIYFSKENYSERKKVALRKLESVISYAKSDNKCRSQVLLLYFGDTGSKRCGKCDVCLRRNKLKLSELEFDLVLEQIKPLLKEKPYKPEELFLKIHDVDDDKLSAVVMWLLDNGKVYYDTDQRLKWKD